MFAGSTYSQTRKIPDKVLESITDNSKKYPEHVRDIWIRQQKDAYWSFSNVEDFGVPNSLSLEDYMKFCDIAMKEYPDDCIKQLSALRSMVTMSADINAQRNAFPKETVVACEKYLERNYGKDIRKWHPHYAKVIEFFSFDMSVLGLNDKDSQTMRDNAIMYSSNNISDAMKYIEDQIISKGKIVEMGDNIDIKDIVSELTTEAIKNYPLDFSKQHKYIKDKIKAGYVPLADRERIKKASDIMGSVFIRKIDETLSAIAVLAELNGRNLILCTREFIPEKFPVVLTNDNGSIVCSSAIVSKNYKLLALIPDSIPECFKPIKTSNTPKKLTGREYQLVTATPEGTYSYPVSFASKTIEGYSHFMNIGNRRDFNKSTKSNTSVSYNNIPKGTVVSKGRGSSFHRSIIIDLDTFEMIAFAVDLNNSPREVFDRVIRCSDSNAGATLMYGNESGIFDWEVPAKLYAEYFNVPIELVWRGHSHGNTKDAVSFVEIYEFTDFNTWESFSLDKYFYSERYLENYIMINKSIFGFLSMNSLQYAESDPFFSRIAINYATALRSKMDFRTYETKYRAYYSSIYYRIKQVNACRIPLSQFYILNRYDAIAAQATRNIVIKSMNELIRMKNISMYIHNDLRKFYDDARKSVKN